MVVKNQNCQAYLCDFYMSRYFPLSCEFPIFSPLPVALHSTFHTAMLFQSCCIVQAFLFSEDPSMVRVGSDRQF